MNFLLYLHSQTLGPCFFHLIRKPLPPPPRFQSRLILPNVSTSALSLFHTIPPFPLLLPHLPHPLPFPSPPFPSVLLEPGFLPASRSLVSSFTIISFLKSSRIHLSLILYLPSHPNFASSSTNHFVRLSFLLEARLQTFFPYSKLSCLCYV